MTTDNDDDASTPEVDFREVGDSDGDGVSRYAQKKQMVQIRMTHVTFVFESATLAVSGDYLVADCDGDGVTNEQEIADGTNPEDPCDYDRMYA